MKIDLRKLYALNKIDIDEDLIIPKDYYEKMNVISMNDVKVKGNIKVNYENNIDINLIVKGIFIMKCSYTFEDVEVPFETKINDEILENALNNEFYLDLLDILWENIILEIPFNVVKEGAEIKNLQGEGWIVSKE